MENTGKLTKTLDITGTVLVWIPILLPLVFGLVSYFADRMFRFDYLMPAELFPICLSGGAILLWAANRAQRRQQIIGWGFLITLLALASFLIIPTVTGLASGAHEPEGWPFILTLISLGFYVMALIDMGIGGILLIGDLFGKTAKP